MRVKIKPILKKIIKAVMPYGALLFYRRYLKKGKTVPEKLVPASHLSGLVVPVAEHCNLRCCGCDHCAPLAEETFYDVKTFESDMKRLTYLTSGNIYVIKLMGGEPLLHPELLSFVKISRLYFPSSIIKIVTNGILLQKQPETFWRICGENNVLLAPTKYPLTINWDVITQKASENNIKVEFYNDTGDTKTSYKIPFDLTGSQNQKQNFINCFHSNFLYELKDGRIYTCTPAPNSVHFSSYFGKDFKLTNKDSIDIYRAKSYKQIMKFLARPIPFCRYCNVSARTFDHPWQRSKKEIEEWT
jgi:MoaA/NifB/PqqE/SkfB family radical SAM enzyme